MSRLVEDAWKQAHDEEVQSAIMDKDLGNTFGCWFRHVSCWSVAIGKGEHYLAERLRQSPGQTDELLDKWLEHGRWLALQHPEINFTEKKLCCDRAVRRTVLRMWQHLPHEGEGGMAPVSHAITAAQWDRPLTRALSQDANLGTGCPYLPDLASFRRWQQSFTEDQIGPYRVAFPVALRLGQRRDADGGAKGAIAWARVWAIEPRNGHFERIEIAPWTFYEPDMASVDYARSNVLTALETIGREVARLSFVVSLEPVSSGDLREGAGDRELTAWQLSPPWLEIEGQSLTLAIGIAALAAGQRLCVPHTVATGRVTKAATIENVSGILQKAVAVKALIDKTANDWICCFPLGNAAEVRSAPGWENREFRTPLGLAELFKPGELVDGFDNFRNELIRSSASPPNATQGPSSQLSTEAEGILKSCLSRDPPKQAQIITLPFGEEPRDHVDSWMKSIIASQWSSAQPPSLAADPVAVPVPLHAVGGVDPTNGEGLTWALCRHRGLGPLNIEAMEVALRRRGKLLLIVYGGDSFAVAEDLNKDSFRKLVRFFGRLAELDPEIRNWQQQRVLFVASDEHHRRYVDKIVFPPNRSNG